MSIAEPFSWKASYSKVYKNNPNAKWLAHERARLECLAIDNEITVDIRKRADGDGFDFKFPDALAFGRFQELAYADREHTAGGHRHTERFQDDEPEFQAAWTDYAARAMNEMGIACTIETDGTAARFSFDTAEDHALFAHLRDIGMFQDMVHHPEEFEFKKPPGYANPTLN